MISVELAWGLIGVAAGASWRWSRVVAEALALAFLARIVYLDTHDDALRWVAIAPGLAGAIELGRRKAGGIRRLDLLSLACVASMASDGAALIGYKVGLPWSLQYVQSVVLAGMIGLCIWPEKEATS